MLDALLAAFVDRASEREFDAPFLAILRKQGFTNIAFLHGGFEFGQDFSAQLAEPGTTWQYGIQAKAGDVGAREWRGDLKPQLQMLVEKKHLHGPAFDPELPRRVVGVLTGRLKGSATVEAEEYRAHVRDHYGVEVEYWDRERLLELLVGSPDALLPRPEPQLITLIGQLLTGEAETRSIELRSRHWMDDEEALLKGAVEAATVAHYAASTNRIDLACHVACCLMRAGIWAEAMKIPTAIEIRGAACRLLVDSAAQLLSFVGHEGKLLPPQDGPTVYITYPARVLRLAEYLSLLALLAEDDLARRARDAVVWMIETQPGAAHPLSDRWGPSVAAITSAVGCTHRDLVAGWLRSVGAWIADRRESGLGLAPYNATPREEVDQLLGVALEHVDLAKRTDSLLAALLLDLAFALEDSTLLDDFVNEWLAVALTAPALTFDDSTDAYILTGRGALHPDVLRPGLDNEGHWTPIHHTYLYDLVELGRAADLIIIASVTRDRHFPSALNALIRPS